MKKTMIALLALLTTTVSASAYDLTVAKSEKGTVAFKVDGTAVTSADDGSNVTMTITPNGGYVVTSVTNELSASWEQAKAPLRAGIGIITSVEMTKVDDNNYTFTMPKANVEVSIEYAISLPVEADETKDPSKELDNVKVGMVQVGAETVVSGQTVIPVAVESIEAPAQAKQTEVTVVLYAEKVIGNTRFVVKEVKADAFKTPAGSKVVVTKVVMPETEEALTVEAGAMKPNGKPIEVETPLAMLDDYALMASLKENFEAKKISATAQAPNRYWTFSSGVDVQVPEGISVYRAFSDNGTLRILPIDEANETKVIKANNGVLLACDNGVGGNAYEIVANPGGQKSGTVPATTDAASYAGNAMVPVIQATNYAAGDFYILKNNVFHTIAGNASKVPACKAVFSVAKGNR